MWDGSREYTLEQALRFQNSNPMSSKKVQLQLTVNYFPDSISPTTTDKWSSSHVMGNTEAKNYFLCEAIVGLKLKCQHPMA